MRNILGLLGVTILIFGIALLVRVGAFKTVTIETAEAGPFKVVFRGHVGPYHKIVPEIEAVEKWAAQNGETCKWSFGEYLDNPDLVEEDRMHSNAGCVVEKDWNGQLPEGLFYREIPKRNYLIATFDGAPSIGPQKVYPKVGRQMEENNLKSDGAVIEFYEKVGDTGVVTRYHFPFTKQN